MRCKICDCILTDVEAVAKDDAGKFLDTCEACLFDGEIDNEWLGGPQEDWLDPDDFSPADDISR